MEHMFYHNLGAPRLRLHNRETDSTETILDSDRRLIASSDEPGRRIYAELELDIKFQQWANVSISFEPFRVETQSLGAGIRKADNFGWGFEGVVSFPYLSVEEFRKLAYIKNLAYEINKKYDLFLTVHRQHIRPDGTESMPADTVIFAIFIVPLIELKNQKLRWLSGEFAFQEAHWLDNYPTWWK